LVFVSPITTPLAFWKLGIMMLVGAGAYFGVLYVVGGIRRGEILRILGR